MISALLGRLRCRFSRHDWHRTFMHADGAAVSIESCGRCGKVDVDGIQITAFNRRIRRAGLPR